MNTVERIREIQSENKRHREGRERQKAAEWNQKAQERTSESLAALKILVEEVGVREEMELIVGQLIQGHSDMVILNKPLEGEEMILTLALVWGTGYELVKDELGYATIKESPPSANFSTTDYSLITASITSEEHVVTIRGSRSFGSFYEKGWRSGRELVVEALAQAYLSPRRVCRRHYLGSQSDY